MGKKLEHADLLEEMSKGFWELINQESQKMIFNAERLSSLTAQAIALEAGAKALREEVKREE